MNNKSDWDELEKWNQNRIEDEKEKLGFEARKDWLKGIKKQDKIRKIIKYSVIVIIIVIVLTYLFISYKDKRIKESINVMEGYYNTNNKSEIEITEKKIGISGNGFYTYYSKDTPNIEIHAFRQGNTVESDVSSRFHKYFFEKWEDNEKDKFVVVENYKDCKYRLTTRKNWLLEYQTYIEVNNYDEMLAATETIIRFEEYMKHPNLLVQNYIKIGNKMILPHNVYPQTYEQIREMAKQLYLNAVGE